MLHGYQVRFSIYQRHTPSDTEVCNSCGRKYLTGQFQLSEWCTGGLIPCRSPCSTKEKSNNGLSVAINVGINADTGPLQFVICGVIIETRMYVFSTELSRMILLAVS